MYQLSPTFFSQDSELVAKNLLGKIIKVGNKSGVILETEAYKGLCDEASHAYPKKTPRNALMYESFGKVYVYLIYGMHYCLNFTSDSEKPGAVLIRSVEDLETGKIYDGPGKLTKFFRIDKSFNGIKLLTEGFNPLKNSGEDNKIQVFDNNIKLKNIKKTPRIGIKKATDKLLRFIGKT